MPIFTIHAPPLRNGTSPDPQRFVFVRDGFHFWAFLTGPFWLLAHRLWLALFGYLAVVVLMSVGLFFFVGSEPARFVIGALLAVLIGLEAASLRRWTYARRKWSNVGIVVGADREEAERRFFAQWAERAPALVTPISPPPMPASTIARDPNRPTGAGGTHDIIGLFPEPGARQGLLP
jgi:hypothetical protein